VTTEAVRTGGGRTSVLRHNRRFRLLWVGQTLSGFGSSMAGVALPLVLLAGGHPTTSVAAVTTVVAVTGLLVRIPAGMLSDHQDQRRLMIACDVVRLAVSAAVALFLLAGPLPMWVAIVAVIASASAMEVFKPSQFQLIRRVVSSEQIPAAVSLNQARAYGASMAGPAAGGLLIGVYPALPFAVDAVTFLASALCVAAMVPRKRAATAPPKDPAVPEPSVVLPATPAPPGPEPVRQAPAAGFRDRLTVGFRHLAHDPFLRRSTVFFSGMTVVFSMFGSALMLGVGERPGGAAAVGYAFSSAALAGLLGSLAAPFLLRRLPLPVLVASGPAAAGALLTLAWLTGSTLAFVAAFSAMSLLVPAINAAVVSVMATSVPPEIYGRVTTANDFVVQLLQPCAPLAAALLLTTCSLPVTALVLAVSYLVLALLAFTLPTPTPAPSAPREPTRSDA
jgi:predicted MFS family arabinose efflux permease